MPYYFNVEVDWDNDGSYADVAENISGEVKNIIINYGRDNNLTRAEVGQCRIVVADSNAKYFYGNVSSQIVATYGGIYPARPMRVTTLSKVSSVAALGNVSGSLGNKWSIGGDNQAAQRFRLWFGESLVSQSGNTDRPVRATGITLPIRRSVLSGNVPGLVSVALHNTSIWSWPDGPAIAEALVNGSNFTTAQTTLSSWYAFAFASAVQLEPRVIYAVRVKALSSTIADSINWFYSGNVVDIDSQYGRSVTSNDGATWGPGLFDPALRGKFGYKLNGHVTQYLFRGYTDNVEAMAEKDKREAVIKCTDGQDQLVRAKISIPLQSDAYSGGNSGMIHLALDKAGWPANRRAISSAELDLYPGPVSHEDSSALNFIRNLEKSEFGFFYIRNDGYATWEDRDYRATWGRSTSSQWTCTENEHVKITPISPLPGIYNTVILRAKHVTVEASESVIWSLQEKAAGSNSPYIGTGQAVTYWARFAASGQLPGIAASVQAVNSGDYLANDERDGSGTDRTTRISTATSIFGGSAKIIVTNLSDGAYLTQLQVRGKMYIDDPPVKIVATDASSQAAYLERHYEVDLPYYQNTSAMQAIADTIVTDRKNPKPTYELELINTDDTIWEQILARRISDRITLSNTNYNISGDFYIEKVQHEITEAGKWHKCKWTVTAA